jgi:pilus assembly protein CpaF
MSSPLSSSPDRRQQTQANSEERFLLRKKEVHKRLIAGMNLSSVRSLDDYELRRELRRGIEELCSYGSDLMSQAERERLINEVIDETLGLGPIEPLLHDPTVSDILINGPKTVYAERRGRLERTNIAFHDEQHLLEIIQRIANRIGRRLDESSPMVDARLQDGSRVNAVIRPLAIDGALVSIRRFGSRPLLAGDLIARKSATIEMIEFLTACVQARLNIIVAGGTGSGKTTFLNMLSGYIADDERIVTIEDAAELQLQQSHVARMETRPPNLEGKGQVTSRDLLRNALRMRPDRIIIGECRGDEAFDMLQAMTTGHAGSLSTVHANDTRDAVSRLEMLVGMSGCDAPMWFIHRMIASAVNIVIHCARLAGGVRRVMKISEVTGVTDDVICMHDIFEFHQTGLNDDRVAQGEFRCTGIRPRCLDVLEKYGVRFAPEMFQQRIMETQRIDEIVTAGRRS